MEPAGPTTAGPQQHSSKRLGTMDGVSSRRRDTPVSDMVESEESTG